METERAHAELGEAKDALAGRRDVLELLHQWITCARGGRNVLAGGNLVSAEEYFPHQVQGEWVPVHRCAVCVMEEDAAS